MFLQRKSGLGERALPLVLATAGVATAAGLVWLRRRWSRRSLARKIEALEDAVLDRLLADPVLRNRAIDVGGLGPGLIELSGSVRTEEEAHHAVAVAQEAPGVRTVLNRMDTVEAMERSEETRRRFESGDPSLQEAHWYGQSVGTGRRRQDPGTEPARPDDKVPIVTRELGTDRATEQVSDELDKLPPAVQGHSTTPAGPTDRGSVSHDPDRPAGNVPASPPQVGGEARVHKPIKRGTEATLEERGLGRSRRSERPEDRGGT